MDDPLDVSLTIFTVSSNSVWITEATQKYIFQSSLLLFCHFSCTVQLDHRNSMEFKIFPERRRNAQEPDNNKMHQFHIGKDSKKFRMKFDVCKNAFFGRCYELNK